MQRLTVVAVILTSFLYFFVCDGAQTYTLTMDQFHLRNGSTVEGYYNAKELRIAKFNRSAFVWNMEVEYFVDFDELSSLKVDIYTSRLNNNQYVKSPFRIPKTNFCEFWKKFYVGMAMKSMEDKSNFPQYGPNDAQCPFKKVWFPIDSYQV